jgi:hypothetical protein
MGEMRGELQESGQPDALFIRVEILHFLPRSVRFHMCAATVGMFDIVLAGRRICHLLRQPSPQQLTNAGHARPTPHALGQKKNKICILPGPIVLNRNHAQQKYCI